MSKVVRLTTIAATVMLTGGLMVGAAMAAPTIASAASAQSQLEQAVKDGKLTQAQADVMQKLGELRKAHMQRYQADARTVIDQAVKDGKLTQEQANKLLQGHERGGRWKGGKDGHGNGHNAQ